MSRKADLEGLIRESVQLIGEYERLLATSGDPKEGMRSRREVTGQWALIEGYLKEYLPLAGEMLPKDILQAVQARFPELLKASARAGINSPDGGDSPASAVALSREEVRRLLNRLPDAAINELAMEYFPQVYNAFSAGMARNEKVNRLMEHCHFRPEELPRLGAAAQKMQAPSA